MNFFQFFVKYSIYHPLSADTSFKFLAIILFEISIYKISSPCLSKGRNLTRGDNSGKTRNMCRLFFHEESIHEVLRRYLEHEYVHTYIRTSRNQYVPHFFKVGGIKMSHIMRKPALAIVSNSCRSHISRVMGKPAFCICENKGTDQLRISHFVFTTYIVQHT